MVNFVDEKFGNFRAFMKSLYEKYEIGNKKMQVHLELLESANSLQFLAHVRTYVAPEVARLGSISAYILALTSEFELDVNKVDPAELDKLNRYFDLFLSIV